MIKRNPTESTVRELGDDILKKIDIEITEKLRASTRVNWQARACLAKSLRAKEKVPTG